MLLVLVVVVVIVKGFVLVLDVFVVVRVWNEIFLIFVRVSVFVLIMRILI